MASSNSIKHLQWYHWCILVIGIVYTLMNTTSVIINAFTCFNRKAHITTVIYNITYNDNIDFKAEKCFNETDIKGETEDLNDPVWGSLSVCFLALPGLFLITQSDGPIRDALKLWRKTIATTNIRYCTKFFGYTILLICYPITLFLTQMTAMLTDDVGWFNIVMFMIGIEGFFHALPQFLLQLFMIANGFDLTVTQFLLLSISFTFVLTNSLRFDIIANRTRFHNIQEIVIYGCRILPQHVTGILFRCCSIVLTLTFLRYWGFIAIGIYTIEIMLIAGVTIAFDWDLIYNLGLTNIGHLNIGIVKFLTDKSKLPDNLNNGIKKFVRITTIVTFVHHLSMLMLILVSLYSRSEGCVWGATITKHWAKVVIYPRANLVNQQVLGGAKDVETLFCLIINNVIAMGVINLIFTLYESSDIDIGLENMPRMTDETDSTRNSLQTRLQSNVTRSTRDQNSFNSDDYDGIGLS